MAVTSTVTHSDVTGRSRVKRGTITFDASYPAGGEAFDGNDIGLPTLESLSFNQGEDGFVFHWDATNEKIVVFGQEPTNATAGVIGLSEVAAATDLSAVVVEYIAVGK